MQFRILKLLLGVRQLNKQLVSPVFTQNGTQHIDAMPAMKTNVKTIIVIQHSARNQIPLRAT